MCIRTKPHPVSAAISISAGSAAPEMSFMATAPAASAARPTSAENVSTDTGSRVSIASLSTAGISLLASSAGGTGGPLRAATAPRSSMSKPAAARPTPSSTACSGVPLRAPSYIESVVTLTIPAPSGRRRSRVPPAIFQEAIRTRIVPYPALARALRLRLARHAAAMRLHRPGWDPAGAIRFAVPRRRGKLFDAPGPRAGGVPPSRRGGGDQVGPARAAGARGRTADRADRLHLRGRLRRDDGRRGHGPDRRLPARRGPHGLRDDRGPRGARPPVRGLRA